MSWITRLFLRFTPGSRATGRHNRRRRAVPCLSNPVLECLETRLAPSTVNLSISNPAPFTEGDSGASDMFFVVTRSGDLSPAVRVNYSTLDGSAHAGVDYVATSGTLMFAADQTTAVTAVPIYGNMIDHPNLNFTVNLSAPVVTTASFSAPDILPSVGGANCLAVADINRDGRPDLAIANNSPPESVGVFLNTTPAGASVPSFAPLRTFAAGPFPVYIAFADINGDGRPDIVVTDQQSITVLMNTTPVGATTPSFSNPSQTFAAGGQPYSLAVGDFNGDGRPDVAVVDRNGNHGTMNTLGILLNTTLKGASAPSFAPPLVRLAPRRTR
jgi:hypothetical protein